jgi:hypothetical protein
MFYGSNEAEGEGIPYRLFRLKVDAKGAVAVEALKIPDTTSPTTPVWLSNGESAFFATGQGIYELDWRGKKPELVWKGPTEGLAIITQSTISPGGARVLLAFWRAEKGADTLIVYDLVKKSQTRSWRVPDRFESDKSGFDLAFAPDGHALYARTYDQASSTPLKRFDIDSGDVTVVNPNSYAVATGKQAVYFIAVTGDARSLRKTTAGASSTVVAEEFAYNSLATSGDSGEWLVSQDYRTKQMAFVDTETDAVKPIGKHDSATFLSDGALLTAKGGELALGDSCKATNKPKQ